MMVMYQDMWSNVDPNTFANVSIAKQLFAWAAAELGQPGRPRKPQRPADPAPQPLHPAQRRPAQPAVARGRTTVLVLS